MEKSESLINMIPVATRHRKNMEKPGPGLEVLELRFSLILFPRGLSGEVVGSAVLLIKGS